MQREEMLAVNALRFLSVDMINQANSGHPGIAIDAAPMAYTLWERVMNFNPRDPEWLNRDRFILSAGHGSALLYSLLHLNGFDLSLADLKPFRQLGSKTPGHPEYGWTPGVDASTGPLSHQPVLDEAGWGNQLPGLCQAGGCRVPVDAGFL